jgi:hypothetical protein
LHEAQAALSKPEHNIVRTKTTIKNEKEKEDVSHEEVKKGGGEKLKGEE